MNFSARLSLALCLCVANCFAAAKDVVLEERKWPAVQECISCMDVQFGELAFKLPSALVGRLFISDTGPAALHVLPKGWPAERSSALFISWPAEEYLGRFGKLNLGADNAERFFDLLGGHSPRPSNVELARRVEGLDRAHRYSRATRGNVRVYWIEASGADSFQNVYFVIAGGKTIYSLAGEVTPELYNAVLSNLTIAPIP